MSDAALHRVRFAIYAVATKAECPEQHPEYKRGLRDAQHQIREALDGTGPWPEYPALFKASASMLGALREIEYAAKCAIAKAKADQ